MKFEEKKHLVKAQGTTTQFLKDLPLFANVPETEIAHFAQAAHIKSYKKGTILYMESAPAQNFYVIVSGWIKLTYVTEEGEEIIIAMLTKGHITGESALFEQNNHANTAQIVEDAKILSIPLSLLKGRMQVNNQLALNMLSYMVQYQRQHELQLEQYVMYSAPQRVGCFILGLCPAAEQKDGVVLELPYDKTLIASTLGMKGPTFSRALNILRDETDTRVSGSHVTVGSIERLLEFVNGCYLPHRLQKK